MLTALPSKIKPTRGFSHLIHLAFNALLPVLAYILVRIDFVQLAILLVLMSKWRMFAVQPRYWLANIVANGVDILVGVSLVLLMSNTASEWWQIFWMLVYLAWLIGLKPRSGVLSVSAQAMVGQLLALSVLYIKFGDLPVASLVACTWAITYICARHFLTSFEEARSSLIAHVWAYFAAAMAFVLGHWLLFYGVVAQIIIFLTTIGYGLAALYYLDAAERLTPTIKRQMLAIMVAILAIVMVLSDWSFGSERL